MVRVGVGMLRWWGRLEGLVCLVRFAGLCARGREVWFVALWIMSEGFEPAVSES